MRFTLENHSGYDTGDLARFFQVAFRVLGVRRDKRVIVVASPVRTRGCASVSKDVRGATIVIAIAPPSRFSMAKLARIVEHEIAHAKGAEHSDMIAGRAGGRSPRDWDRLHYSEGPLPWWARGLKIRYRKRAPDQMRRLGEKISRPGFRLSER